MERWALHSTPGLDSRHHSWVIRGAVDIGKIHIRRMRALRSELLLIVKLLLCLLSLRLLMLRWLWLLLPRLQDTLLFLQAVRFAHNAGVIRRCLHWHSRSTTRTLWHPGLRHHLHRHRIRRNGAIHGWSTSRHTLHVRSALADAHPWRYAIRQCIGHSIMHPVRCSARYTGGSRIMRYTVRGSSRWSVHHRLLARYLTCTLSCQIRLEEVSGRVQYYGE